MPREASRPAMTRRVLASDPNLAYHLYVPKKLSPEPRLVVSIHGASRNIDAHARLLSAYADMYGAVLLVPHFSEAKYRDYQRLGRTGRGRRADLALHRLVAEAAPQTQIPTDRFYLFGFSGGAQFAHRYAMAYPHRIAYAVIANSGRYTLPDPERKFPRGLRSTRKLPGLRFDLDAVLRVPMKVFVGKEVEAVTLPRRRRGNGENVPRAERGRRWVAAMEEACRSRDMGSAVTCEELPDRIRSFRSSVLRGGLAERAFKAMFGSPLALQADTPPPDTGGSGRQPA